MSIITVSRDDFIKRYDAHETKQVVIKSLKSWDAFLQSKSYAEPDLFAQMRQQGNAKYIVLDQWAQFALSTKYVTTVKTYLSYVKAWIKYNDIEINTDKVKDYVKFPKIIKDRPIGIDRNIVRKVLDNSNDFYKAFILVLSATGMRNRSEVINMKWTWVNWKSDPPMIIIPAEHTKTKQERITFLTPETVTALEKIPRNDERIFPITYDSFYTYLKKIRTKLGLNAKTSSGVYHFKPHRFRGYAENKLSKSVGEEFAHAITGHGNYLGQYFAGGTTDTEAGQDYKRAIKDLTVYSEEQADDTAGIARRAEDEPDTPA